MRSRTLDLHNPHHPQYQLGLEAGRWLAQLTDTETKRSDPYEPSAAFLEWVARSPAHLAAFLDTFEAYHRLGLLDPQRRIRVEELLQRREAPVVQLYGPVPQERPSNLRRRLLSGVAAVLALLVIGSVASRWRVTGAQEFSTDIGEQRTCKLEDASFVYLNTDSRIKVDFSRDHRRVELASGEALFAVEHDVKRPFIVTAGGIQIRAVGTQFNVRRRADSTDVAVVEGTVQVATTTLAAGQKASFTDGHLSNKFHVNVVDALSWRQRRLVFQDTPMAVVAAEFNRYNTRRIRVAGSIPMELTGVFDADRPDELILYAQKQSTLSVEADGENWIIRSK